MTTTATDEDRVTAARRQLDKLRDRIARGDKVSGADITHAEGELRVAELAAEGERQADEDAAAKAHTDAALEAVAPLTDTGPAVARLVEAHARARQALADLHAAADEYQQIHEDAARELKRLQRDAPLPAHLAVSARGITIDGHLHRRHPALGARTIAALAHTTVKQAGNADADPVRQHLHDAAGTRPPTDPVDIIRPTGDDQ